MQKNLPLSNRTMPEFSKRLQQSENVLEYSLYLNEALHLNIESISKDNIGECINKITDTIWNDYKTFVNDGDLNFFGYKGSYTNKKDLDLSLLSTRVVFWEHALKQHAIISAFDKLRKVIGESYPLSQSKRIRVSNYTLEKSDTTDFDKYHHGFDFLTMENNGKPLPWLYLTTTENDSIQIISNETVCQKMPRGDSSLYNKNAKNHICRIRTLNNNIEESGLKITPLLLSPAINPGLRPESLFSLLEFYNFTVNRQLKPSGILPILDAHKTKKAFSPTQYNKYIVSVNHLLASIAAKDIDKDSITYDSNCSNTARNLNLSDKIYLRYQIEKVFAPSTINCLYQNAVATKDEVYDLSDQKNINLLAACLRLPNVFTRQYILQMAIDTITKHHDYSFKESDFFMKKRESSDSIMSYARTKHNHLSEFYKMVIWSYQYRNAMNYLTQILFPVHENYFFCALWNIIKNAHPHNTDAQIVVEMYKLLQYYLNNPEYVAELFATDDVIINSLPKLNGFKPDNIIHPLFISGKKVDTTLYKHCLIAHTLTYKDELIPDFISLSYLDKIAAKPHRQIQDFYILESALSKQ